MHFSLWAVFFNPDSHFVHETLDRDRPCMRQVRYEAALALRGLLEAASGPAPLDGAEAMDGFDGANLARGGSGAAVAGAVRQRAAGALRGLLGLLEAVGNDDVSTAVGIALHCCSLCSSHFL